MTGFITISHFIPAAFLLRILVAHNGNVWEFDYSTISLQGFPLLPREELLLQLVMWLPVTMDSSSKANWRFHFSPPSVISADLLGNRNLLKRVQKVMICDWWISIRSVGFIVSRFVACDSNYYWRQRKTQLWRRLLNFRVRVFVKSAVINSICFAQTEACSWSKYELMSNSRQ